MKHQMEKQLTDHASYKAIVVTLLGQGLEWYDFSLYLYLSVVFAKLYFPTLSTNNSLIAVSSGFTLMFLARIAGAYVYGRYGDTKGRAKAMVNSMVCLGISTLCLAFLPTYNSIGWLAPTALFLLRIFQGFSLAGEVGGAVVYINELSRKKNTAKYFCFATVFSSLGTFSASGLCTLLHHTLSPSAFYHWGWRLLYILAALLSTILYYYRKQLVETKAFITSTKKPQPKPKLLPLIKTYRRIFFISILMYTFSDIGYIFVGPVPAYLHHIFHINLSQTYSVITAGGFTSILILILLAFAINRFIPKAIFGLRAFVFLLLLLATAYLISMFTTQKAPFLSFAITECLFLILSIIPNITCSLFIPKQFPTHLRYTATALILNINAFIFGGLSPLLSSLLMKFTGHIATLYALGLAFILISIIPLAFLKTKSYSTEDANTNVLPCETSSS